MRKVSGLSGVLCWSAIYLLVFGLTPGLAGAADFQVPAQVSAGRAVTIRTAGSGDATFYLIGPVARVKEKVRLGESVALKPENLRQAGRYLAILRSGEGTATKAFFVIPAEPGDISFLAQPSRVPAAKADVISGTAFVMDRFHNLITAPTGVKFELSMEGNAPLSRSIITRNGVAWTRMDSSRRAGAAQFTASVGDISVKRVVQQTAAEPCNLRMHAQPSRAGILVETDPVRDCSGNPVPDGTIISFTDVDPNGRSTVDAVLKRGIARAEFPAAPRATISVASGVVMGNEIRWGGQR
jgi:hypothetical protein